MERKKGGNPVFVITISSGDVYVVAECMIKAISMIITLEIKALSFLIPSKSLKVTSLS